MARRAAGVARAACLLAISATVAVAAAVGSEPGSISPASTPAPALALDAAPREAEPDDVRRIADIAGWPSTWCGNLNEVWSGVEHAGSADNQPSVKVVLVRPADAPDRLPELADEVQAGVAEMQLFFAQQSSMPGVSGWAGQKAVRFDVGAGPDCPQGLDLAAVTLSQPAVAYADRAAGWARLTAELHSRFGDRPASAPRHYLVIYEGDINGACGMAQQYVDDRPYPDNANRGDGQIAVVANGCSVAGTGAHELLHTFGAVAASSPHAVEPGHCWDSDEGHGDGESGGGDLMCYGVAPPGATAPPCSTEGQILATVIDCGHDDYYAPQPEPGSWIAEHVNTYQSPYFASCAELRPACGYVPRLVARTGLGRTLDAEAPTRRRTRAITAAHPAGPLRLAVSTSWQAGTVEARLVVPLSLRRRAVSGSFCLRWVADARNTSIAGKRLSSTGYSETCEHWRGAFAEVRVRIPADLALTEPPRWTLAVVSLRDKRGVRTTWTSPRPVSLL